eukprot:Partr_v1_DN26990_c0_g1_i2_m7172 putative ubiquitin carboxyl-terminal hydrolase
MESPAAFAASVASVDVAEKSSSAHLHDRVASSNSSAASSSAFPPPSHMQPPLYPPVMPLPSQQQSNLIRHNMQHQQMHAPNMYQPPPLPFPRPDGLAHPLMMNYNPQSGGGPYAHPMQHFIPNHAQHIHHQQQPPPPIHFMPHVVVPVPAEKPRAFLPEIFPFKLAFGEFTHAEIVELMRDAETKKNPFISLYSAWHELRVGKRSALLTFGKSPNTSTTRMHLYRHDVASPADKESTLTSASASATTASQQLSFVSPMSDVRINGPTSNGSAGNWASLFRGSDSASRPVSPSSTPYAYLTPHRASISSLSDYLHAYEVRNRSRLLIPRGLVNRGNMCFMNAILQPLLHCGPFYQLFHELHLSIPHDLKNTTPLIDALILFISEFVEDDGTDNDEENRQGLPYADSFIPEYVYDALNADERFKSTKGRQQDAEEFLGFLLDGLHEELIKSIRTPVESPSSPTSNEEWMEVGPRSKITVTRNLEVKESPITKIFGGQLRSVLRRPGIKESVTIEPFHSLPLDISHDDVNSVEDALKHLSHPETIEGWGASGTAPATKQILVEKLPPVLILHLKRFVFVDGTTQKLHKHMDYNLELEIPNEILAPNKRGSDHAKYCLFAAVYHHGKSATDGHYTCEVRRSNGEWMNFDDVLISRISIFEPPKDRSAYILFYIKKSFIT